MVAVIMQTADIITPQDLHDRVCCICGVDSFGELNLGSFLHSVLLKHRMFPAVVQFFHAQKAEGQGAGPQPTSAASSTGTGEAAGGGGGAARDTVDADFPALAGFPALGAPAPSSSAVATKGSWSKGTPSLRSRAGPAPKVLKPRDRVAKPPPVAAAVAVPKGQPATGGAKASVAPPEGPAVVSASAGTAVLSPYKDRGYPRITSLDIKKLMVTFYSEHWKKKTALFRRAPPNRPAELQRLRERVNEKFWAYLATERGFVAAEKVPVVVNFLGWYHGVVASRTKSQRGLKALEDDVGSCVTKEMERIVQQQRRKLAKVLLEANKPSLSVQKTAAAAIIDAAKASVSSQAGMTISTLRQDSLSLHLQLFRS